MNTRLGGWGLSQNGREGRSAPAGLRSDRLRRVEEDKKSVWARSILLRVVTYSTVTSAEVTGFAAWLRRDDLVSGRGDSWSGVLTVAGITFLLSYYFLGGVLWLTNALIELCAPSTRKTSRVAERAIS